MEIRSDEPLIITDEQPTDDTQPFTIDGDMKLCQVCGLPIERQPGRRRGKYHDDCRPVGAAPRQQRTTNIDQLISDIAQLHVAIGAGLGFVPTMAMDGMVISTSATDLAESWRPLILKDKNIRMFWEKFATGAGWGKVILAYGMVGMAIASNHGVTMPGMVKQS